MYVGSMVNSIYIIAFQRKRTTNTWAR